MLTVDTMDADEAQTLSWLVHTNAPFEAHGKGYVSKDEKARLVVIPLGGTELAVEMAPTVVQAGRGPGNPKPTQRAHHLKLTTKAGKSARMATLLVPLAPGEAVPEAAFDWASETLTVKRPGVGEEMVRVSRK
jgi:hypothetical protein